MKCLIIAAGKGSRLRLRGASKPLISISGVPLIERVIRSAREAGADDFYVVTGYHGERVRRFLKGLSNRTGIRITPIVNGDWEKANGLSVIKARQHLREPFLLLMADHLFEPSIARELMALPFANGAITLGVDRDITSCLIDMGDVTRVMTEDGKINNIGKGLTDFNGFDTGIFRCTPAIFGALERCAAESGDTSLSGAVQLLAAEGRAKASDINGHVGYPLHSGDPNILWFGLTGFRRPNRQRSSDTGLGQRPQPVAPAGRRACRGCVSCAG